MHELPYQDLVEAVSKMQSFLGISSLLSGYAEGFRGQKKPSGKNADAGSLKSGTVH